jgi:hypothetical protein
MYRSPRAARTVESTSNHHPTFYLHLLADHIIQLDDLRLTIPRVVEPLYSPPTPSTFRALKDNLVTSQDGIKEFRKQWQAKETQQVFEYGRQSLKRNGDMSKSVEVDKYGWVERERKGDKGIEENNELKKDEGDRGERMTQAEISRVVDEWKGKMPKVVVKSEDENKDLTVCNITAGSVRWCYLRLTCARRFLSSLIRLNTAFTSSSRKKAMDHTN